MGIANVDAFIEAHGIKGQKWGIRNDKPSVHSSPSIKVDESPWSNYHESDYSQTQWHNACLIHNHSGGATAKNQCKLPIKTPSGVVNRHGVYAAASVLAGGRGGVDATSAQKDQAAQSLISIYKKMNVKPPPSLLLKHSNIEVYLEHYGKKGMKWGIHTEKDYFKTGTGKGKKGSSSKTQYQKDANRLSDAELKRRINRMELEKRYHDLKKPPHSEAKKYVHDLLQSSGRTLVGSIVGSVATVVVGRAIKKHFGG
jgi:hypothetical protein